MTPPTIATFGDELSGESAADDREALVATVIECARREAEAMETEDLRAAIQRINERRLAGDDDAED